MTINRGNIVVAMYSIVISVCCANMIIIDNFERKTNNLKWCLDETIEDSYKLNNNINAFCKSSLKELSSKSENHHSAIAKNLIKFCNDQLDIY